MANKQVNKAQSTYNTRLYVSATKEGLISDENLVPIKDFPDLGGSPEMLETTTLLNKAQTYIHGIQSMDALEFTTNYSLDLYKKIKALENKELYFELHFGEDDTTSGTDGKFEWQGELTTWATGHGVNEVREMIISIAPSTEITLMDE